MTTFPFSDPAMTHASRPTGTETVAAEDSPSTSIASSMTWPLLIGTSGAPNVIAGHGCFSETYSVARNVFSTLPLCNEWILTVEDRLAERIKNELGVNEAEETGELDSLSKVFRH